MKEHLREFIENKQLDETLSFNGWIKQGDVGGEIKLKRYIHNEYNIRNESFEFAIRRPSVITSKSEDKLNKGELEYLIEVIGDFDKVCVEDDFNETFKNIKDVKELLEETLEEYYEE